MSICPNNSWSRKVVRGTPYLLYTNHCFDEYQVCHSHFVRSSSHCLRWISTCAIHMLWGIPLIEIQW